MSERWQREVRKLGDVEPGADVWEDARTRTPNGDDGLPPARQRLISGVVAFAVFIGAGLFAWQAFRPFDKPNPVGPIARERALVVSISEPGAGQEVPNTFTENEPRPTMTATFDGVALDGNPVSYTWCQEPGVDCSSVDADYDITFFQPVPAGTDVIVEGDANDVSGSFHLWRGEGSSLSMAEDVPVTPGSYELLVDATFDRGEVTFSVGIKVIDAQPAWPSGSPSTSEPVPATGAEHLVGDIDAFNTVWQFDASDDGTTRCQRLRPSWMNGPRQCVDAASALPDVHLTEAGNRLVVFGAAPAGTAAVEVVPSAPGEPFTGTVLPPSFGGADYPFYAVALGGSGPGTIRFLDAQSALLFESDLSWTGDDAWKHPNITRTFPASETLARATDPLVGPWWIYGYEEDFGPVVRVRGPDHVGGFEIKPVDADRVLGTPTLTGFDRDELLVVVPVSPNAARVEVQMDDGTTTEGMLYPMPESLIGPANLFVTGIRAELTAEGQSLSPDGIIVAYDADGQEIARRGLTGGAASLG